MSASVTLTRKFEIWKLKDNLNSELKEISKSIFQVPSKIKFESKIPNLILKDLFKSNCKGNVKIVVLELFKIEIQRIIQNRNVKYVFKSKFKVILKSKFEVILKIAI